MTDYDRVELIQIDSAELAISAASIKQQVQTISDALLRIGTTTSSLTGNWVGGSADDAQELNADWQTTMKSLFGTEATANDGQMTAEDGILNVVAMAVDNVAHAFAKLEYGFQKAFTEFGAPGEDNGGDATPADVLDTDFHAITADYPPYR